MQLKLWLSGGLILVMFGPKMQADLQALLIAGQFMILKELQMS
jgi:hypothetical protein